jgi:hypothetical protein
MSSFEPSLTRPLTPESHSQNRKFEEKLEILSTRLEELGKLINMKTERLTLKQRAAEERQDERANQLTRNFETRVNHLRKLVENQENQIYRALTELEELRREIARLKR